MNETPPELVRMSFALHAKSFQVKRGFAGTRKGLTVARSDMSSSTVVLVAVAEGLLGGFDVMWFRMVKHFPEEKKTARWYATEADAVEAIVESFQVEDALGRLGG